MSIERINISNFTVFKEVDISFCSGINVIIGENGTGKTHLLKLLYAFCENEHLGKDDAKTVSVKDVERIVVRKYFPQFQKNILASFSAENEKVLSNNTIPYKNIQFTIVENGQNHSYNLPKGIVRFFEHPTKNRIPAVFVPAKDMLTHSGLEKDYAQRNLPFDITLIDILNKAGVSTLKILSGEMKDVMEKIEQIIGGKIIFENDKYSVLKKDGLKVSFGVEAEGFKKLGLICRLIETGNISSGSVLIWDEPEANINPNNIPAIADILLALQENGVQIFIATHDYFLAKYINVRKKNKDQVIFHSLYKEGNAVRHESETDFDLLENNVIMEQSIKLYKEEIERAMK